MGVRKGTTQILVYMPDDILSQVNAICDYRGINRSALINHIVGDYAIGELKKIDESKNFSKFLRKVQLNNGLRPNKPKISLAPVKKVEKKEVEKEMPKLPDWRDDLGL